ncbi:amidohydrolase family protein [Streptomyces sp. NPDC052676]|uniref:amidohydrolase family protein n=1 Tax=Streptomyces sp. NPDC052676 TaxID=3154953 RepID=UPI0034459770
MAQHAALRRLGIDRHRTRLSFGDADTDPITGEPTGFIRNFTFHPPREFAELLARLDARGFQCFVHATGDRGIRTVLDAVAHARAVNGPRDARHQVVHVECLDPADVPRFAELGVVACMQPRHCAPEIAGPGRDWAENITWPRWAPWCGPVHGGHPPSARRGRGR